MSYTFSFLEPGLEEIELRGTKFSKINMQGCIALGKNVGEPSLPVKFVKLLIPPGKTVKNVLVSGESKEVAVKGVNLREKPIVPYQNPVTIGSEPSKEFVFNNDVYNSLEIYPNSVLDKQNVGYCRGYAILDVAFHTIQYNPGKGQLYYYPRMKIDIELQATEYNNQFFRNNPDDEQWVKSLVYNPEIIEIYNNSNMPIMDYPGGLCDPSDHYDYVIITTTHGGLDHWETSSSTPYNWTSLMDKHFTDDGLVCALVTVQNIYVCSDYYNSDPLFNDSQAKIREFCKDAYQDWETDYIFIGGDAEWIPARLMNYEYESNVDSDLYWSNLDNTFNADHDSAWGEEGDSGFDLYSELFIGRITCDEPQDVSNWMKKSFYYADNVDKDYLENAAFYGGDLGWNCEGDDFIDYSAIKGTSNWLGPNPGAHGAYPSWLGFQYGFETWNSQNPGMEYNLSVKWTAEPPNPGGWMGGSESTAIQGLRNAINNDQVTLISAVAHANEYMSMDVDYDDWEGLYHNTKPFFITDYGCHCGDMDAADDGVLHSMLFHSDTELVFACVYNTCYGWGSFDDTNSSSALQQKSFWDYMFDTANNSISPMNWQLGKAHAWSKDLMALTIDWTYSGAPGSWRGVIQGCLLFGDPAQRIKPPIQPDHNIGIQKLDVKSHEPADADIWVNATLYNNGKFNETNVEVRFLVNGTEENTTTITFFEKNTLIDVGWLYHTPSSGWETLTVNVTMVSGENISNDNEKSQDVIYGPDIAVTQIQAPDFLGQGFAKPVKGYIENLGSTDETITINFIANDILEDSTNIYLTSGSSTWVTFMWDGTNSGLGTYDVIIHAVPVSGETYLKNQEKNHTVTVFAAIGNILLVDDDAGGSYETWYENALLASFYVYDIWDRSTQPSPTPSQMQAYTAVVWFTGDDYYETLGTDDQNNLATYLGNGGKLFVSGQDIGYEIGSTTFYSNYLHASYQTDSAGLNLIGETGDVIGDGLEFDIQSGDGANNQNYPDGIQPISPATSCFYYGDATSYKGCIRVQSGAYRIVYLSFGFEAINNMDDRVAVMSRSLAWMAAEHDIAVLNLDVLDYIPHGVTTYVGATILNGGINDETNILVNFTVDGIVVDSTVIGSLNAGHSVQVSFAWNPGIGTYLVGIEAKPVPGENITSNNAMYKTVHVVPAPDIWVEPTEFDLYLDEGVTYVDTLTIGNEETAEGTLEFEISYAGDWGGGWVEQWSHTYGGSGHSQFAQPVGDIDEDGKNETLVGGYASYTAIILTYNPVSGNYEQEYEWQEGSGTPSGACVVDLDNDGDLEFCVSWVYGYADGVYAYDWDGSTLTELDYYSGIGFDFAFDIYACDYDEDGKMEVLIANWPDTGSGYHVTALGWSSGHFVYETSWSSGESTENPMIWSGDTDNDGHIEVIVAASYNKVHALNWDGSSWNAEIVASGLPDHPYAIVCGDIDGDGIDEIGIGLYGVDAYIYEWDGSSYVQTWHDNYPGEEYIIEAMYFGDADNDGNMELIVGTDDVHVIGYNGYIYYEESVITQTDGMLAGAIIADMDDDGKNEVKACDINSGLGKEWIVEFRTGWLSVDPTEGSVEVGNFMDLDVIVDTLGLAQDTYNAYIVVTSNDLDEPIVYIPVNLTVVYSTDVGTISINYPTGTIENGSYTVNATVKNFGSSNQPAIPVHCEIMEGIFGTFLDEDFSGSFPPNGWSQEQSGEWQQNNGNYAGGTPPEAYLPWSYISGDYAYLDSVPVDTIGAPTLTLEFKHYIDYYAYPFNCRVLTRFSSSDTWTDVTPWQNPVPGDIGPQTCTVDITADIGSGTQVRFEFEGYYWNLNYWYLDDVKIYSEEKLYDPGDIVYTSDETVSIPAYSTAYVEFTPPWDATAAVYAIKVTTQLPGDQNNGNNQTTSVVTVTGNTAPYTPKDPYPENDSTNIGIDVELKWNGGDKDQSDTVTYDIYFGTNPDPPHVTTIGPYPASQTQITWDPGTLDYKTTYYWKIIALDNNEASSEGPIWMFTTVSNSPPNAPTIDGPNTGKPRIKYEFTFIANDPEGHTISYYVDWGDGTFTNWTDYVASGTKITLNHTWTKKANITIKAKAKDVLGAESGWSEINVNIPRNKISFNSLLLEILERFTNAFTILKQKLYHYLQNR
ncbi:MAG: FG-GAP-like repeat-containing protein [Thermoplasmatota archaeon]